MSLESTLQQELIPDKGFYKATQFLHDGLGKIIQSSLDNLPARVMLEAFGGAYLLTKGFQYVSKRWADRIIPGFDDKILPFLERGCEIGIPAVSLSLLLLYSIIDSEGTRDLIYNKPMDNLGIICAYAGGVLAAEQDLRKRRPINIIQTIKDIFK